MNGNYVEDNGRITGTLNGHTLDGYWGEDSSARRCDTQRLNTFYWGRIHWEFHASGFRGKWGYCEASPTSDWTGTLTSGFSPYGRPYQQGKPNDNNTNSLGLDGARHVWNSTEGTITAGVQGSIFSGTYDNDNGRISGNVSGNIVEGYWGEDSSGKRCAIERLGTFYWGRIRWTFNNSGFTGRYSYCDDEYSGNWNGTLVGGSVSSNEPPPPSRPTTAIHGTSVWSLDGTRLTMTVQNNSVSGNYIEDNGRISGTLTGNTMDGFWGEDTSARRCDTQRLGTFYWGRTRFVFNGSQFTGLWGYCDAEPTSTWNGTLIQQQ
jgi:hypothetical protein